MKKKITMNDLLQLGRAWGLQRVSRLRKSELGRELAKALRSRTVKELTELARRLGLGGMSKARKDALVATLARSLRALAGPVTSRASKLQRAVVKKADKLRRQVTARPKPRRGRTPGKTRRKRRGTTEEIPAVTAGELEVVPREPLWLYCWWELHPAAAAKLAKPGAVPLLRVVRLEEGQAGGHTVAQVELPLHARSWHLRVDQAGARYQALLGSKDSRGRFHALLKSVVVSTPAAVPSSATSNTVLAPSGQAGRQATTPGHPTPTDSEVLQQLSAPGLDETGTSLSLPTSRG